MRTSFAGSSRSKNGTLRSGSPGYRLDEKAIEAVREWRFKPGMKDGKPVAMAATVVVNFNLLSKPASAPAPPGVVPPPSIGAPPAGGPSTQPTTAEEAYRL